MTWGQVNYQQKFFSKVNYSIRICVGILLKGLDQTGAPKLMNILYILSTTEEKTQKGHTHAQCQDPSHT